MAKLDTRAATRLPGPAAGSFDKVHWDDELAGFGLRVLASGRRGWIARYRVGGKQRVVGLGTVAELDAPAARAKAKGILAGAALGHDERLVVAERRREASAKDERPTVRKLAELRLAWAERNLRPASVSENRRYLLGAWAPILDRIAAEVDRKMVATRLAELAGSAGGVSANRARSALGGLWGWAIGAGLIETDPVSGTTKQAKELRRERVLTAAELRRVWQATGYGGDHDRIVRLLLLTGQRRGEVGGMRRDEIEGDLWRMPGSRTKNGKAHEVSLSRPALAIVDAALAEDRRQADGSPRGLLFGDGPHGYAGWSKAKVKLDKASGVTGWTIHDLRRTVVTGMAELGIDPHVIELVINHVSGSRGGVAGRYNHARQRDACRAALDRWAAHVTGVAERPEAQIVELRT